MRGCHKARSRWEVDVGREVRTAYRERQRVSRRLTGSKLTLEDGARASMQGHVVGFVAWRQTLRWEGFVREGAVTETNGLWREEDCVVDWMPAGEALLNLRCAPSFLYSHPPVPAPLRGRSECGGGKGV